MLKLKVFSGYADEVERAFNTWMAGNQYEVLSFNATDQRLYVFYKDILR